MSTHEKMRSKYEKQKADAEVRGWTVAPEGSAVDQEGWWVAWMTYWCEMDAYERDPSGGRPVIPYRSG